MCEMQAPERLVLPFPVAANIHQAKSFYKRQLLKTGRPALRQSGYREIVGIAMTARCPTRCRAARGAADYLLYVNGASVGVVEAKKKSETLAGCMVQAENFTVGLTDELKPHRK
jgi:type I site-specific restriction endonuclease